MTFNLNARLMMVGLAAASVLACGDDGDGEAKATTVDDVQTQEQSVSTGRTSAQLGEIPVGADQAMAQSAISSVGNAIQAVAARHQQVKAQAQAGLTAQIATLQQAQVAEGTVNVTENRISANVSYQGAQAAIDYVIELDIVDNDVGGKTYDGTFDMAFATSTPQYDITYDYDARYDMLALDGTGCPVSGALSITYDLTLGGSQFDNLPAAARQAFAAGSGALTATFGPACGDVAVTGR